MNILTPKCRKSFWLKLGVSKVHTRPFIKLEIDDKKFFRMKIYSIFPREFKNPSLKDEERENSSSGSFINSSMYLWGPVIVTPGGVGRITPPGKDRDIATEDDFHRTHTDFTHFTQRIFSMAMNERRKGSMRGMEGRFTLRFDDERTSKTSWGRSPFSVWHL